MKSLLLSPLLLLVGACSTPGSSSLNSDFSVPTDPEIVRAFALRDRNDLPKPTSRTAIYVDSVATHHTYTEASTIVWKDEKGEWRRSQVIEEGPGGLLKIERRLVRNLETTLDQQTSQLLDSLIQDPDLYAGVVQREGDVGIGAPYHVMAIVSPYGRTTVAWGGRLVGTNGAVADIVLGHP